MRRLLSLERWINRIICSVGWSRKYYVFLICIQEKDLHFEEKVHEKSGKNIRQACCLPRRFANLC